jgi:hypothetical protein
MRNILLLCKLDQVWLLGDNVKVSIIFVFGIYKVVMHDTWI